MKKSILTTSLILLFSGVVFANNGDNHLSNKNNKTDLVIVSNSNENELNALSNIISVKISTTSSALQEAEQYYDITCANGTTAHKAFDSYQAAWSWGLKFCAYN